MKRLAIAIVVLLAAACSSVDTGTVTDKKWWDEYWTLMPVYTSCGNGCSTMTTEMIYTPSCWEIYLRNGDDTGALCVEPDEWMRYQVGQEYP